jgi:CubicO group peptidase (beta-lactamase class C family)
MSLNSRLPRCTPEEAGMEPTAILDFIRTAEQTICYLHSFMLLSYGQVVAEGWWYPWRAETPHELYSLSKSFTSTAIGMAVAEGRLSVDDQVISFFPGDTPKKVSHNLAAMKVHHLLSMSTGHDQDSSDNVFPSRTPFKTFLSLDVEHTPGTHFVYNTAATFMLSAILQKTTGQDLLEYLKPKLFEPLDIRGATWEHHPNGVVIGGYGLRITTEDIAKFGQLYLQKGIWQGRCIVPQTWLEAATKKQVSNGDDPNSDWRQGYGYQFWRCRHNCYRGDGAFGQFCLVMPKQDAVLAITAGVPDMQVVLDLVWEKLLPVLGEKSPFITQDGGRPLADRLKSLEIEPPPGAASSKATSRVNQKSYTFDSNYEALSGLCFDFGEDSGSITYQLAGEGIRRGTHSLQFGYGSWLEGKNLLGSESWQNVATSGCWTSEDTIMLTICQYETPYILTISCRFAGERMFYDCKSNVAFGPTERPQLVGTSE